MFCEDGRKIEVVVMFLLMSAMTGMASLVLSDDAKQLDVDEFSNFVFKNMSANMISIFVWTQIY